MMGLRGIHLLFITASIALTIMVAAWGVAMYGTASGHLGHLAFAAGSGMLGVGMAVYLAVFIKKSRAIGME